MPTKSKPSSAATRPSAVSTPSGKDKDKKHAKYSPSSAERWWECAATIQLSEGFDDEDPSEAAEEGTQAHTCLEVILTNGPHRLLATTAMLEKSNPKDMVAFAANCAKHVWKVAPKGSTVWAEREADLRFIDENYYGTLDITVVHLFNRLYITDFKYGYKWVSPEKNKQLLSYALAMAELYGWNFEDVQLGIYQPRNPDTKEDGSVEPYRSWLIPISELEAFAKEVKKRIAATKKPNPVPVSGEHCFFCPAKLKCPEYAVKPFKDAAIDFDDDVGTLALPVISRGLTPERLGTTLSAVKKMEVWIEEVRAYAKKLADSGVELPGWKLVNGRSSRKWTDAGAVAQEAKKKFKDKAYTVPELLSPAQLEKIAGKDWVAKRVTNFSGNTTLVPESDKREAVNQIDVDFSD